MNYLTAGLNTKAWGRFTAFTATQSLNYVDNGGNYDEWISRAQLKQSPREYRSIRVAILSFPSILARISTLQHCKDGCRDLLILSNLRKCEHLYIYMFYLILSNYFWVAFVHCWVMTMKMQIHICFLPFLTKSADAKLN